VVTLPAHLVATPVLERLTGGSGGAVAEGLRAEHERLGREGRTGAREQVQGRTGELEGTVLGAGDTAVWIDLEGFAVVITTREVPLLPNAIALAAGSGALVGAADGWRGTARLVPGRVALGSLQVTWDAAPPPSWDPTVPVPTDTSREAVAARGAAILHALGSRTPQHPGVAEPHALLRELARLGMATAADPEGAAALTLLFRAVRERDPEPAAAAVRALLGRGPGLTPEGDDLLAAAAGTLAVLGPAMGQDGPVHNRMLEALAPIPGRTTALSATLLILASERRLPEPAGRLLDLSAAGETAWPAALARLERLGHGSGRAYAAGIAATALLLAGPTNGLPVEVIGPSPPGRGWALPADRATGSVPGTAGDQTPRRLT
jgi:Protein of unknown function (DUF2877)